MFQRPNDSTPGFLRIGNAEYPITRDGLRDAFDHHLDGLHDLRENDVYMLAMLVGEELCRHNLKDVDGRTSACKMSLGRLDTSASGVQVRGAYIRVDGAYFEDREAISIEPSGWVGFAGWADSRNERPFLVAFARWMDEWLYSPEMRDFGGEGD